MIDQLEESAVKLAQSESKLLARNGKASSTRDQKSTDSDEIISTKF